MKCLSSLCYACAYLGFEVKLTKSIDKSHLTITYPGGGYESAFGYSERSQPWISMTQVCFDSKGVELKNSNSKRLVGLFPIEDYLYKAVSRL